MKIVEYFHLKGEIWLKRFLYFFIWALAIGLVLYLGMQIQSLLIERSRVTFNPFPLGMYVALFPVVIGALLVMPEFLLKRQERMSRSFDWIKFAAAGVPALFVVLLSFFPFSPLGAGWLPVPGIL